MRNKSQAGQSQLLIVLGFVIFSALVFATNSTLNFTETYINESFETNLSSPSETNISEPENTTIENITVNITLPHVEISNISVNLLIPEKITRGEKVEFETMVSNVGEKDIKIRKISWVLPQGFETIEEKNDCEILAMGSSCSSLIRVKTTLLANLGKNRVEVSVEYE